MPEPAALRALDVRLMPLRNVIEYCEEWSRLVIRRAVGSCPHCGREVTAEAGQRGFCPYVDCAGEVLAILRPEGGS